MKKAWVGWALIAVGAYFTFLSTDSQTGNTPFTDLTNIFSGTDTASSIPITGWLGLGALGYGIYHVAKL